MQALQRQAGRDLRCQYQQEQQHRRRHQRGGILIFLDAGSDNDGMRQVTAVVEEMASVVGEIVVMLVFTEMDAMHLAGMVDIQVAVDERRHGLQQRKPQGQCPQPAETSIEPHLVIIELTMLI